MIDGAVDGFEGSNSGLTPLAGAIEDAAGDDGVEDPLLARKSPSPAKKVHQGVGTATCGNLEVIQKKGEINFKVL